MKKKILFRPCARPMCRLSMHDERCTHGFIRHFLCGVRMCLCRSWARTQMNREMWTKKVSQILNEIKFVPSEPHRLSGLLMLLRFATKDECEPCVRVCVCVWTLCYYSVADVIFFTEFSPFFPDSQRNEWPLYRRRKRKMNWRRGKFVSESGKEGCLCSAEKSHVLVRRSSRLYGITWCRT